MEASFGGENSNYKFKEPMLGLRESDHRQSQTLEELREFPVSNRKKAVADLAHRRIKF